MSGESEGAPQIAVYAAAGARLPRKATPGSAGYDVCACLESDTYLEIPPGERLAVPTGLFFEIPPEYFITLRPRSGLALEWGVTLLNSPATIDSDYRGELKVILINQGSESVRVEHGDRIAQLFLESHLPVQWRRVYHRDDLSPTTRGGGGFGSTGVA